MRATSSSVGEAASMRSGEHPRCAATMARALVQVKSDLDLPSGDVPAAPVEGARSAGHASSSRRRSTERPRSGCSRTLGSLGVVLLARVIALFLFLTLPVV